MCCQQTCNTRKARESSLGWREMSWDGKLEFIGRCTETINNYVGE